MTKFLGLSFAFFLSFAPFGCQSATETRTEDSDVLVNSTEPSKIPTVSTKPEQTIPIDVAKLANRSIAEFDRTFDKLAEGKTVAPVGEFRLYKIAGQSKGLSVRFYEGRAKSFNLISDDSFPTSKEALKQIFNIDVGNSAPVKSNSEPLTEKYQGVFGGVKFKKVSAKRAGAGKGFIFVLAEAME